MSCCLVLQSKDSICIGADTATSVHVGDKFIRQANDGKKIFEIGKDIVFCSGDMSEVPDVIKNMKTRNGYVDIGHISGYLKRKTFHKKPGFDFPSIGVMICRVVDGISYVYDLLEGNNFDIMTHTLEQDGVQAWVGGIYNEKCLEVAIDELARAGGEVISTYVNTYKKMACQEIGGNINVYHIDSYGYQKIIDNYDLKDGYATPFYGVVAPAIVGNLICGDKMYIGNKDGSVEITGNGIKINRGTITWGSDNVNAPEMSDISGLAEFKNKVNTALTGSTTEIGSDYVISPKIGGGYLFIKDNREIDNTGISVEINPNGTAGFTEHNGNYVFNISKEENNSTKLIMGVKNDGDGYFSGEITAESGSIGGWNINNGTLSSSGTGGEISLNSGGNSIYSISGDNKAILTSGYLGFEKNDKKYVTLHTTSWKDKPNVYGVGINSEADSKFISFGNKKSPEEESYTTPLVLNYGLDPNEDKQDVLVYGSTLITGETTIKNKLYFNDNFYLNSWNKNGNLSGIGCNGDFSTIGNINAGNIDYGCRLNVDGSAYVNGSISTSNGDVSLDGHNLWTHAITWSDNDNARTDENNKSTDLNLASVRWVRNNFTRKDSDERVKCNFTSLPNQIDEIFDAFSPRQYEYKEGLEKTGFHFGDTAQHIESVLAENNLNPSDYAITGERRVDMEGKEKDYITNDTFHYIDQNNIIWLCVDQIQKLKKREKAVPDMLKLIQEQKEEIDALNSRIFALEQENKDFRHKLENLEKKISSLK